ncbi:hypothetical protein [Trueperella bialowiezensis]|uniref:hypothetical protein n=1 Tax=Trueperella bialowiezensis TaxID=312285 RepID=UPI000F82299D|nr:hypothetical protein [Trueperella bialowiezensis]
MTRFVNEFAEYTGFACPPSSDPALRAACDFVDGIAGRTGVLDTILFQPTGASQLVVGFAALPGALGRAMTDVLGVHSGRARPRSSVLIAGGGELAACAIAAAVQHGYSHITVASDQPGLAMSAAHRMGVDIDVVKLSRLHRPAVDLLINTIEEPIDAEPAAVCDMTGAWEGCGEPYVCAADITAHQRQDQIRVLTGKNPQLEHVRAAI